MPRRSKEDALATRASLLDAAEHVFQAQGVSGTSLADIAAAAGTTRGAIYWHFKDKADLYNAMMERVTLPMEHAVTGAGALADLRAALLGALEKTATDPQTRRVFEVATHKVEYTDSLGAVRQRHIAVRDECIAGIKQVLHNEARRRGVRLAVPAEAAARGLQAMVDGLIQNWLLDTQAFELVPCGRKVIDTYLGGLGLKPSP